MNQSREKTVEEMKEELLNHILCLVDYWNNQSGTTHDKLDGLAFSILSILDGCTILPAYSVIPLMAEEDKEYYIENGENYYPEEVDIAGSLHDTYAQLSSRMNGEKKEKE